MSKTQQICQISKSKPTGKEEYDFFLLGELPGPGLTSYYGAARVAANHDTLKQVFLHDHKSEVRVRGLGKAA